MASVSHLDLNVDEICLSDTQVDNIQEVYHQLRVKVGDVVYDMGHRFFGEVINMNLSIVGHPREADSL